MAILALVTDGLAVSCITFPHEWSATLSIAHRFPCVITPGGSGREGRRPKDEALAYTATVHLVLAGTEAQAFRQMLATIGKGFAALPVWHDTLAGVDWDDRIYDAERILDITAGAIIAKGDAMDDAHDYVPLIIGRIQELPELPADTAKQTDFTFVLVEEAPNDLAWSLRVGINAVGASGDWPAGLEPDWNDNPVDQPTRPLEFDRIGEARERVVENEEMAFRWGQEAGFTLASRDEIRALLAFFLASEGPRRSFTSPWWLKPGVATAEAPASTVARFAVDSLRLDYHSGAAATTKIRMLQVPWEIVGVEGEDPEQPPRVFFYRFTHRIPDPQVYRFTNWPRALARAADGTYAPGPFKHDKIVETLDLRGNGVTLESFIFEDNPLMLFRPDRLEAPLGLEIFETETWPIDPDAAVLRWSGEVKRPSFDGRRIQAKALFLGGILEREIPGVLASVNCSTKFGSTRCGKVLADFEIAGTFTSAAGCVLDIAAADASAANFYVYGVIQIGAGATWEQRGIIASEPIVGGQRITVDWPVRQAAAGQAVVFRRGCDLRWSTCQVLGGKFRGIPHMALPQAPGKK